MREKMNIYDFTVTKADGEIVSMKQWQDHVMLIMNSATECGFTPQYQDLQLLYEKYKEKGFVILDFPCNQFGNQAPGSSNEIAAFCDTKYGVTFPIFEKIEVNGSHASPLFQFLKSEKAFDGFDREHKLTSVLEEILEKEDANYKASSDIKWNFTKFLVDRKGNVVERFEPTKDMKSIEDKIKELL